MAMQGAVMGTAYVASLFLGGIITKTSTHPKFVHTIHLKHERDMCYLLEEFEKLGLSDEFGALVENTEHMYVLLRNPGSKAKGWLVNRLMHAMLQHVVAMCDRAKRSRDSTVLNMCVLCEQDHIPVLRDLYKCLMMNVMLEH